MTRPSATLSGSTIGSVDVSLLALWVVDVAGTRAGTATVLLAASSRLTSCKNAARGDALAAPTALLVGGGVAGESGVAAVASAAWTGLPAEGVAKGAPRPS